MTLIWGRELRVKAAYFMFIEMIIMFREQIKRVLIMMAVKAEDRAFISIKH